MGNAPLKIGLLTPACRGFNSVDGGIAAHFADLAIGLSEAGHAVRLIVTDSPAPVAVADTALAAVDFRTVPVAMPPWLHRLAGWHWPLHTLAGRRLAIRRATQVMCAIHATDPLDCIETDSSGLLALHYVRAASRAPVITRVSTTAAQLAAHGGNRVRWHDRQLQRWEARLARASDMVLTHTETHRRQIAREFRLDPAQVRLIAHGIALPRDDELSARPPEAAARVRLLFVGRFEHRKGIDVLLTALPGVLAAAPAATCQLIGEDGGDYWQRRFWEENPGIDRGRVAFSGKVDAAQLRAAYRECDVFVAPSRYESFGLIYAEAMAWAKPVVACRAGGVPEIVLDGETGLLVEPGDNEGLAAQLIRLLNDPARRARMGAAGRTRVQTHFSRTALAQRSAELYVELADRRRHVA